MKYTSLLRQSFPGAVGLIVAGPIGLAGGLAVGGTMAYEFEKHIWKKILDVVKRESKVYNLKKVIYFEVNTNNCPVMVGS